MTVLDMANVRIELSNGDAVIDGIDVRVSPGEILGLVGESGSGKTTTALSIFGYNAPGLKMAEGEIAIAGEQLRTKQAFRDARGRLVSYVPQNPGAALNPALRIADAIEDMVRTEREGHRATDLLERVGLPNDHDFARRFPHQLSGGQQQRVCIAASLAPDPVLVVLDEPTTGLDVVTQDRILKELLRLRDEQQVAMLYITHDLAVVAQIAERIAVMYAGRIVEQGPTAEILQRPRHPYTRGLLAATPDHLRPRVLGAMPGIAVGVGERPAGCPFAPRCPQRQAHCETELPQLEPTQRDHEVRCFEWRNTPPVEWAALDVKRNGSGGAAVLQSRGCEPNTTARAEPWSLRTTCRSPVASAAASRSSASRAAVRRRSRERSPGSTLVLRAGSCSAARSSRRSPANARSSSGGRSRSCSRTQPMR